MSETINHHLSDEVLMAYSAGALPEAFALMAAAHVSMCDQCRAQLESYDALGGAILDDLPETADLSADCLEATLAMISDHALGPESKVERRGVLPEPLQDYVGGDLEKVRWRPVGMGVKQAILPIGEKGATARLLFIPAGAAVPDHGHHGTEMTMVLKGAFTDGEDRFARGDVEMADEDTNHMPVADISEDCICLAVTDAKLKFNSWIPRLAQPFLRI